MSSYQNLKKNLLIFIYFFLLLIIGFFVFSDYGISIDEDNTRINGFVSLKYIFEIFFPSKIILIDQIINVPSMFDWREHLGVVFDLPTAFLEILLQMDDSRDYYLMRHLINFLIFFTSVYFFYLLVKNRFNSQLMGIFGSMLLFASPRIFAESFYNNKDIVFMSLFTINIYTAILFLENPNFKNTIIFSLLSALAIDTRILGIILPVLIFFIYIMNTLFDENYNKRTLKPLILFLILTPLFIILFWPYLWESPWENFSRIFKSLSSFDVTIYNFYFGQYIYARNIPWHYPIVWIFITTPIFYITLFIIGFIFLVQKFTRRLINIDKVHHYNDLWKNNKELQDFIFLFTFLIPIITVIILGSTLYDGWRHLYFIYPSFLLISLCGFNLIKTTFFRKKKNYPYILSILLILPTIFWMYKNHPYQNVYFNLLSIKNFNEKFEMDYSALSNKNALEYITSIEDKEVTISNLSTNDLNLSKQILKKKERDKIVITYDINVADYLLNNYRDWTGKIKPMDFKIPENFKIIHEIKIDEVTINTIYKKI